MQVTEHFSIEELTASDSAARAGIDNSVPEELLSNLHQLAFGLEEVRALLGHSIHITSGYRCAALNKLVGGQPNSQHQICLAADTECPQFGSPLEVARAIESSNIQFDQLIHEFGRWCHVSFPPAGVMPRKQCLTIDKGGTRQGLLEVR